MEPTIQKLAQKLTKNPRFEDGASSVTKVNSGGIVAPIPTPAMQRNMERIHTLGATALRHPATALHTNPSKSIGRRPNTSPIVPMNRPPTSIPKNTAEASNPPRHAASSNM
mmetsp:Transcript_12820/g.37249  ORF Transcript_12820/g.37249 Transcript_12820/m.37249 type:complete len:111 (+) Transcript_12820:1425-1757(+)